MRSEFAARIHTSTFARPDQLSVEARVFTLKLLVYGCEIFPRGTSKSTR